MTQHLRSTLDLMVHEIEAIPEEHWEDLLVALREFRVSAAKGKTIVIEEKSSGDRPAPVLG